MVKGLIAAVVVISVTFLVLCTGLHIFSFIIGFGVATGFIVAEIAGLKPKEKDNNNPEDNHQDSTDR